MSESKSPTPSPSLLRAASKKSITPQFPEGDDCCRPEFIYGGPFIKNDMKVEPFMNTSTPINMLLQGTFKKSYAYYSLKERLPIILTKIIDRCSRDSTKIKLDLVTAGEVDLTHFIQFVGKLKSDLITNKKYEKFVGESDEAKKWNQWIDALEQPHYFTNTWVFTECYVYRKLREGCEVSKGMKTFDPFEPQKVKSFQDSLEHMCIVADKVVTMLPESAKDKRKADFITLLKLCLWANKCDLSLSAGEQVTIAGKKVEKTDAPPIAGQKSDSKANLTAGQKSDSKANLAAGQKESKSNLAAGQKESKANLAAGQRSDSKANLAAGQKNEPRVSVFIGPPFDPFQMIIDCKDKLLVDDSAKIADAVVNKAEAMSKLVQGPAPPPPVVSGTPHPDVPPPPPASVTVSSSQIDLTKFPCPAKMTVPRSVMFDIILDNAGYELFTDLCFAHFLVSQKIVEKIRFHLKKIPWFVSDVTSRDFKYVIDACSKATYSRTFEPEAKPAGAGAAPEGAAAEGPRHITSDNLRELGKQWKQFLEDGTFEYMREDYWTYPHVYKDMKTLDFNMYRKLQFACALLFKGDLNYRKLLGEKNWNPYTGFEPTLQGFIPAPIIAVRTVKSELICGLPKGKFDQLMKLDEKWMEKGDYGVIQYCAKAEPLKPSPEPCYDYGSTCFGKVCPEHSDL